MLNLDIQFVVNYDYVVERMLFSIVMLLFFLSKNFNISMKIELRFIFILKKGISKKGNEGMEI